MARRFVDYPKRERAYQNYVNARFYELSKQDEIRDLERRGKDTGRARREYNAVLAERISYARELGASDGRINAEMTASLRKEFPHVSVDTMAYAGRRLGGSAG